MFYMCYIPANKVFKLNILTAFQAIYLLLTMTTCSFLKPGFIEIRPVAVVILIR